MFPDLTLTDKDFNVRPDSTDYRDGYTFVTTTIHDWARLGSNQSIGSPHLVHPEQIKDVEKEVIEEG
jgi:hypothetical protein